MQNNLLKMLSEHRTLIFLIMCLCVHIFNVFLFWKFGLFTATIGLCTGESIADYEEYLRQADEKLYWGKNHGKNQIVK